MEWQDHQIKVYLSGAMAMAAVFACLSFSGCGSAPSSTNTSIQSAPLAGPSAAFLNRPLSIASIMDFSLDGASDFLFGIGSAEASVSTFSRFAACNDTLILLDSQGNQIKDVNGNDPSVGLGLLDFSPTSTSPMTFGSATLSSGTSISEADITFAVVPALCGGANYAVEFNDGIHGTIDITQNTAFKFKFNNGATTISGSSQTVTLMFGQIVNGMVSLGASLNNSTIQTVNVGQAQ